MKLYNLDNGEWREGGFKRGDSWRVDVAYQCEICHVKTNRAVMGGPQMMTGPRILCHGDEYQEHDKLESLLKQYKCVDEQIKMFEEIKRRFVSGRPLNMRGMMDDLYVQVELLNAGINGWRGVFSERLDDIEGLSADFKVKQFYPVARHVGEKKYLEEATEAPGETL